MENLSRLVFSGPAAASAILRPHIPSFSSLYACCAFLSGRTERGENENISGMHNDSGSRKSFHALDRQNAFCWTAMETSDACMVFDNKTAASTADVTFLWYWLPPGWRREKQIMENVVCQIYLTGDNEYKWLGACSMHALELYALCVHVFF